jgi:hypothetical protein
MNGADVKAIRLALRDVLGYEPSCHDLGLALGLAPANAKDTVRKWEADGPTGPAATALKLFALAVDERGPPSSVAETGVATAAVLDVRLDADTALAIYRAMTAELVRAAFRRD